MGRFNRLAWWVLPLSAALTFSGPAQSKKVYVLPYDKKPDGSYIRATLWTVSAYFDQADSWFGNAENLFGERLDHWWETQLTPGVQGSWFIGGSKGNKGIYGELFGRASAAQGWTDQFDAGGSTVGLKFPDGDAGDILIEEGYVGWRSGDAFPRLGHDFFEFVAGPRRVNIGTGMLIRDFGSDGGNRGAFYLGPRKAPDWGLYANVKTAGWLGNLWYVNANDKPNSNSKLTIAHVEYTRDKLGTFAGMYIYSEAEDGTFNNTRDGMNTYDFRLAVTPLAGLRGLEFSGEYAYQDLARNAGEGGGSGNGFYGQVLYHWEQLGWKPNLRYRYASFDQDFDPLYYGFTDWGYWFQGEILGEYVLLNNNLNTHMVRFKAQPVEQLTVNLFYYYFQLYEASSFDGGFDRPVTDTDFAHEVDLIADWTVNDYLGVTFVGAWARPQRGAKQAYGGNSDWWYMMLYASLAF